MQLNIMHPRAIDHIAQNKECWQLADDQLVIDLDISEEKTPPGTQPFTGAAIIKFTSIPHDDSKKFVEHFGLDAMKWLNSIIGKERHLRNINAKVVHTDTIRAGNTLSKVRINGQK